MESDSAPRLATRLCAAITIGMMALLPHVRSEAASSLGQGTTGGYPNRPIRIIDGFPAGGASDYMVRLAAQKLTERFGQPIIVDNRPGAGGNIGAEIAAKATPDGYTLFMALVPVLAPGRSLYPRLPYNVMTDFAFVTLVASGTFVLLVHPSVPAKSVSELVALAKSSPGKIKFGSAGVGSATHLAAEMFNGRAGVSMLHVPYKGAAQVTAAMVAGEVQLAHVSMVGALPLIKAGRLTALGVTSAKRARSFPELPTIAESGFAGFDVTPWYGVLAPAATPAVIITLLNVEIGRILQLPDIQAMYAAQGLEATGSTPERFKQIMQAEIEKWAKVIKEANIKAE